MFVMSIDTNKTHDALVADWKGNAKKRDDENYWFLRSLKLRSVKKVDRIALELHRASKRPTISATDVRLQGLLSR